MKRLAVLVVLAALLGPPARAQASFTGTVRFPNPAEKVVGGVTENAVLCDPKDALQGFDGWWIKLPSTAPGKAATLSSRALDMDVWFYDVRCNLILEAAGMATDLTGNENGTVPAQAAYAIVNLAAGWQEPFTFAVAG